MLVEHCKKGYSFESFAADIDCNVDTLYEWVKVHHEFSEAKKRAVVKALRYFESLGIAMSDPRYDTGKANVTSWIYQMKCRFKQFGWNPTTADMSDAGDDFEFK